MEAIRSRCAGCLSWVRYAHSSLPGLDIPRYISADLALCVVWRHAGLCHVVLCCVVLAYLVRSVPRATPLFMRLYGQITFLCIELYHGGTGHYDGEFVLYQ